MTPDPNWREDPTWELLDFDADYWSRLGTKPPQRPPAEAELAQPDCWASLYYGSRPPMIVATWWRPTPDRAVRPS